MEWSGPLALFDSMTQTPVNVRAVGSFDGTIAHPDGEKMLRPLLLEAVRAVATQHDRGVLCLVDDKDVIARAAQEQLAGRLQELGAVGTLSIAMFTFDPADAERLQTFVMRAAMAKRAAKMAAAAAAAPPPATVRSAPCAKCGSTVPGRFCTECGAPRVS